MKKKKFKNFINNKKKLGLLGMNVTIRNHEMKKLSIHELAKVNPTKTYRELEKIREGICMIEAMRKDRENDRSRKG
jgi:hypothetical protein